MLNMALIECLEDVRGMRPVEEIAELIQISEEIRTTNPVDEWDRLGVLDTGGQAQVYKVKRKSDGLIAAMKRVPNVVDEEVKKIMEDASLISYLNSDEMIKCVGLYYYKKTVYIMLDLME